MKYLYIPYGEDFAQSDTPPTEQHIEDAVNGMLDVFRFENGRFEQLTPIDNLDGDNWTEVGYDYDNPR